MSSSTAPISKFTTRRRLACAAAATVLAATGLALAPGASAANSLGFTASPGDLYGGGTAYAVTTEPCLEQGYVGFYRELPNVQLAWRTFTGKLNTSFTVTEPGIYSVQAWCGTEWLGRAKVHVWESTETTVPGDPTPTTVPGEPTTTLPGQPSTTVPGGVTTTTQVDVVVEGKTQTSGTTSASAAKPVPSTASYAG